MSTMAAPALGPSVEDLSLEDQISARAQEICEQRGGMSGSDVSDWLQAEQEILAREEYCRSWKD